jgi:hypothetical protein
MKIGFERLLTRLDNIRFGPNNDFKHIPSASFRGFHHLQLEFDTTPVS